MKNLENPRKLKLKYAGQQKGGGPKKGVRFMRQYPNKDEDLEYYIFFKAGIQAKNEMNGQNF